jgi:hypothetical protein
LPPWVTMSGTHGPTTPGTRTMSSKRRCGPDGATS